MKLLFHKKTIFLIIGLLQFLGIFAQYIPKKPNFIEPVYDEVGLLNPNEKEKLNQKLKQFYKESSTEILIAIIPSTQGEDINYTAARLGKEWGIGDEKLDNGLVFLIATKDKKISIQQGRAIEQYITASEADAIINNLVTPAFKQQDYYLGIDYAVAEIINQVKGKFTNNKKNNLENSEDNISFYIVLFGLIIFFIYLSWMRRKINYSNPRRSSFDDVIISNRGGGFYPPSGGIFGGSWSNNDSGSSSSDFGGFGGGGDFGGGGASGEW